MANDPLYYKQNVNLFVALAPSARLSIMPEVIANVIQPLFTSIEPYMKQRFNSVMTPEWFPI
jgi:hypothetical protein